MSKKYPSTICGVVFQNADKGRYKCQFTFACDGRSDMGRERTAWNRSAKMAEDAFYEFQKGERPGVVPDSVLFYHTTAVAPRWSHTFQRVAAIGSHIFYAKN
jgi:spore germination cell wall hydrolase CwlJ-like protein